jgi:hypothetical protein
MDHPCMQQDWRTNGAIQHMQLEREHSTRRIHVVIARQPKLIQIPRTERNTSFSGAGIEGHT